MPSADNSLHAMRHDQDAAGRGVENGCKWQESLRVRWESVEFNVALEGVGGARRVKGEMEWGRQ